MTLDTEIIQGFKEESKMLVGELRTVVEKIKTAKAEFPSALLAEFAQKIDRIMGTAKTLATMEPDNLALQRISRMSEMCKAIGYKASEQKDIKLLNAIAVIWADVLKVIETMVDSVEKPEVGAATIKTLAMALKERLKWLSNELKIDLKSFM